MVYTANSSLYAAVQEAGINMVINHIKRQRPSWFNYGTKYISEHQQLLCQPIDCSLDVDTHGTPHMTVEADLPVLGSNGIFGVNYCFQITKVEIDFHPGTIPLPPELTGALQPQCFALHVGVCAGIGCPDKGVLEQAGSFKPSREHPSFNLATPALNCFCIDFYIVGHAEVTGPPLNQKLTFKLDGLEIVDIKPDGLENSFECYLKLLLQLVLLPNLRITLEKLIFEIYTTNPVTIQFSATPVSAQIPHNPAIEQDQLKVFINEEVQH